MTEPGGQPLISFFDTATLPSPEMLDAIRSARLGDDGYGRDPTVNRLESLAAEQMGTEAAVLMPSGTMSNLAALLAHTRRGDEVVIEARSHIACAEAGGIAALAGCMPVSVEGQDGVLSAAAVEPHLRGPVTMLCVENTHNRAGGTVTSPAVMAELRELCDRHGLQMHLDGARIFNAAVALDVPVRRLTEAADSVCFSISKALGAPAGSLLCGDTEFIARARRMRKMLGGGMRQAGVLAAPGLVALRDWEARLAEDHRWARRLAERLAAIPGLDLEPDAVQTNIVLSRLQGLGIDAPGLAKRLLERGIACSAPRPDAVRFVVHSQIRSPELDALIDSLQAIIQAEPAWS